MLSGSETAITSIPKQKVHQLDDTRKNNRIKRAKENIEKTIGGILVGNNFVNILMASVATLIFVRRFGESAGSAIATIFTTVIVLIFGDITPKTLATKLPIVFLSRTTFLVELLSKVFAPFTELITKIIMKFVRSSDEDDAEVTEADIQALTALGEIEGQILPAEREIIDSLLDFETGILDILLSLTNAFTSTIFIGCDKNNTSTLGVIISFIGLSEKSSNESMISRSAGNI